MATIKRSKKQKPRKFPKPKAQKPTAVHKAIERNIAKAVQKHRRALKQFDGKPRSKPKGRLKAIAAADQENARARDERAAAPDGMTASERAMARSAIARGSARKPAASGKRLGILNAALQILKAAKQPMRCKDIVQQALAKKLWYTNGKTPEATLNAAIIREIAAKGQASRFKKVERGLFAANAKA